MGANVWRNENEWPLARTKYSKFYLHSGGQANTRDGNGALRTIVPGDELPDSYLYDPRNPAPSNEMGWALTTSVRWRNDPCLVYSTPVLENGLEVTGPVKLIIDESTTAVRIKILLANWWTSGRNGAAYNVAEGIMRRVSAAFADEKSELLRVERSL